MSEAIAFVDTLKFAKRLVDAGIDPKHAEAITEGLAEQHLEFLNSNLATKVDIANLKTDLANLKTDLAQVEANLKIDLAETESKLIKWMVGIMLSGMFSMTALFFGLVKFAL